MSRPLSVAMFYVFVIGLCVPAYPAESLIEQLQPLAPFVGKTWKGEFASSTTEQPVYDVSKWERALNGRAVRVLHSVNDGAYGGESIIVWDQKKQTIVFYYFTTAGFVTEGTMQVQDGKIVSHEHVSGEAGGVTEVKSTSEILPDGRMQGTSKYLKDGQWVDGHKITYREAPDAKVVFK